MSGAHIYVHVYVCLKVEISRRLSSGNGFWCFFSYSVAIHNSDYWVNLFLCSKEI